MVLKVLFFAQCADWMGTRELEMVVEKPIPLSELVENSPELRPVLERLKGLQIAINREITGLESEVRDGDEVAFLPPVSGG